MAKDQTKPVNAKTLKADRDALAAVKKMTGYQPADPNSPCTLAKLTVVEQAASDAADAHAQAKAAHKTARDADVTAQWALHNAMLGARTFLAPSGDALQPGLRAQATPVAALQEGFRDLAEAYLLEFLITRLGDVGSRDHVALAHALFRQFDARVPLADLEDRVVLLLATLHDRITLRDDGTYSLSQQHSHAAAL